jgi:hypothetical protein
VSDGQGREELRRSSVTVARFGAPQLRHRFALRLSPPQRWSRPRTFVFLHFALDSDLREPLLLVAARPISGACAPRGAHGEGFRRGDDFEVVRVRDRSRVLEYGVTKTRV